MSGALKALFFFFSFSYLKEAEDIKKRWQEYTEELYERDLHDPDNQDAMITYLEPDILEYKIKWALRSITTNKASGGDGIPVELFQILKDDAVKVLYSVCQQIWKTQQWPQDWKRSVFIPVPKKGNECLRTFKLPHNCTHLTRQQNNAQNSASHASTIHEVRSFRCSSWIQKRQRNQKLNCQLPLDHRISK